MANQNKYTIFSWIDEICVTKRLWEDIPDEMRVTWNTFMVNRILSHDNQLLPIVNEIQEINFDSKYVYELYRVLVPKKKRYIKLSKKSKSITPKGVKFLAKRLEVSTYEAAQYINLLSTKELKEYYKYLGLQDKEIKDII